MNTRRTTSPVRGGVAALAVGLALLGSLWGPNALASPTGGGQHLPHVLHVGGSVGARQLAAHLRQVPDLGARG
jgi:hypothetical protein